MRTIVNYWRMIISLFLITFSKIIKRKNNWIAFGAWRGELYIDNSRYLLETALSKYGADFRFVWIGNDEVRSQLPHDVRLICCRKNSLKSFYYLLKCKYMFCSQMHFEDLSNYNIFSGSIVTYLHHGCPVKKWGDDALGNGKKHESTIDVITGRSRNYEYFVCSSERHFQTNLTALKSWGCTPANNQRTGTPRNDLIVNERNCDVIRGLKDKYANLLGFPKDKGVVLYVPTFRRSGVKNESLVYRNDHEKKLLSELLQKYNCVLVEKAHFAGSFEESKSCEKFDNILSCPKNVNLQEMLLFTDCMISDYSGALLDYAILDRPIVHYIYDLDFYRDVDSGLYYDFTEFQAGPAATDFLELLDSLKACLDDPSTGSDLRNKVRDKFMEFEIGNASNKILDFVVTQGRKKQ